MPHAHAFESDPPETVGRHQEAIVDLGLEALRETDTEAFLSSVVVKLSDALGVEFAKVLELLPGGDELLLRAGVGWKPGRVGRATVPTGRESQAGFTLLTDEPVIVGDLRAETRFSGPNLLHEHGVVSGLSVVIPGDGKGPFGVLGAHTRQRRIFTAEDVNLFQSTANIIAGAIRRHEQEKALRAAEARYRNLVEGMPFVTYIDALDEHVTSIYASPQIEPLLGFAPDEWAGDPELFARILHPEDRDRVLAEHGRLRDTGERLETEYRMVGRDGRVVWVRDQATVVEDEAGSSSLLQGVLVDITERKRLEDQLRQSQRMEAIGQLTGGIAHDFNNLLTAIIGYSDFLLARLGDDDPLRADAEEISTAAARAAALTRQLLAFSRKQVLQPKILDLNDVVVDIERMLRRLLGEHIELLTVLEPELGRTKADPGQIEQVIVNLVVNARDAMPEGGTMSIETANVELDESAAIRHLAEIAPGPYVALTVSDTGIGMDQETQSRLFEPFFTTKEPGQGTGLGLSTVYGIVKQSGGFVWVYSEPDRGTIFKVYLPRVDDRGDPETEEESPREGSAAAGGDETILLVEDEELVRNLICRDLEERGFTVLVASGSQEALELLGNHPGPVDLLLTDVVMPASSGLELAAEVERLRPGIRVLYMSGYAGSVMTRRAFPGELIEKPFSAAFLVNRIRGLLDVP